MFYVKIILSFLILDDYFQGLSFGPSSAIILLVGFTETNILCVLSVFICKATFSNTLMFVYSSSHSHFPKRDVCHSVSIIF